MPSGYIYSIIDESNRRKLGMAQDVDMRRAELQVGNAELLTVEYRLFVKNMKKAEMSLHMLFARDNIRGEWFCIQDIELFNKIFGILPITEKERIQLTQLYLR